MKFPLGWFTAKPVFALICCLVTVSTTTTTRPAQAASDTVPLANERVLVLGDSITQSGDYVTYLEYALGKGFPREKFDIISIGLASETTSGLTEKEHPFPRPDVKERLGRALALVKPQTVMLCYGMNDGNYHPQSAERMKVFQSGITSVLAQIKAAGAKAVLLTPPPFDSLPVKTTRPASDTDFSFSAPYVGYNEVLADYAKWELTLRSPEVSVIDLNGPLNKYIQQKRLAEPDFSFASDGIHPDANGHLLMARTILSGWNIEPLNRKGKTKLLPPGHEAAKFLNGSPAAINSDPLFPLVKKHREERSSGWLSYVGYTRGETAKTDSIEATETAAAQLQTQIDEKRSAIRVACVGDSITFGAGTSGETKRYPATLGRWMGKGYEVRNFGVSARTLLKKGDFPYTKEEAYRRALAWVPNIVVIALGTNDSKHPVPGDERAANNWQHKADFVPDYKELITSFRQINPDVKIYVCTPPTAYKIQWGINDSTIRQEMIPLVKKIAKDTGAKLIDLNTATSGKAELFPDFIHPNDIGAALIAAEVQRAILGMSPYEVKGKAAKQ